MTADLFGIDPMERIAELERRNAELTAALKASAAALLKPVLVAMHEAMEATGQAGWEAEQLLDRKEEPKP